MTGKSGRRRARETVSWAAGALTIRLADNRWRLEGPDGATSTVRHRTRFVTDDMIALRQAVVAGAAIVQLPAMMACRERARGVLVKVIPAWLRKSGIIHAVFRSRRGLLPSVRKLIDFLAVQFG